MRAGVAGLILAGCLLSEAGASRAQTPESNRRAYDLAARCFVANVVAAGNRRNRGDEVAALRYETTAEVAFNAAVQLGRALGLSGSRIEADIDAATDHEMPRMMRDQSFLDLVVGQCRGAGMMAEG